MTQTTPREDTLTRLLANALHASPETIAEGPYTASCGDTTSPPAATPWRALVALRDELPATGTYQVTVQGRYKATTYIGTRTNYGSNTTTEWQLVE